MGSPSFHITQANPIEAGLLTELARTTFQETYGGRTDPVNLHSYIEEHLTLERLRSELETPGFDFHLAWVEGLPAGYLKLRRDRSAKGISGHRCLQVERIYVLRQYQGLGIGRALLSLAIEAARAGGDSIVWLQVWQQNHEAIGFYQSHGFQVYETATFAFGGETTDDYLMRFDIHN